MGRTNKRNYECEIMDGVKMKPLLLNNLLMKDLLWQNFSLLFDVIYSEKYLGYAICHDCCLLIGMTRANVAQRI